MNLNEALRTFFCVLNNPEKIFPNLKPEQIVDKAIELWMTKETRGCGISYEIGDSGTPHLHMVLYDSRKNRGTAIKKLYGNTIHLEPMRGKKQDAIDYLNKAGKFEEKAHTIIVSPKFAGNIEDNRGKRTDLESVQKRIDDGMKPNEIMDGNIGLRRYSKMIREAYFQKRIKETPPLRDVTVIYHVGEAGTGKSYSYIKLVEEYGEDSIYLVSDYENGGMDMYEGEEILFLDEYKGSLTFQKFLQWLDRYKIQIHARYGNTYSLWNTVIITSVFPPEEVYSFMVEDNRKARDSINQLLRRLDEIVYHYIENGEYKTFSIPAAEYVDYDDLKQRAFADKDGFMPAPDEPLPFD